MGKILNIFKTSKNIKRIIAFISAAVVVALLAVMPLLAKQNPEEDGPKASILSGKVTTGSINTELVGGGTLAEEKASSVSVPSAVKLKKFLVSNGDAVTEGTAIASVDRVTVMKAISQVQETLEYLSEQIEKASDTTADETVSALAGGTVKILYAEKGNSVQSVMLEHGALAVLSLDGLMAVDLETETALTVGTVVKVTLANGKTVNGKITKNLAGEITVTIEDDDYAVGDQVEVKTEDGTVIGTGKLYIYSPWNATAYAGTVKSIKVSVGDKLRAGKTIMVLSDGGYSATYRRLIGQRQEYEALLLDLFKMYQTETVIAPCDGVVSGIDKDSAQLLSSNNQDYSITFLANAPNGDDQTLYLNYIGKVTAVAENGWALNMNPQAFPVADYLDLTGIHADEALMTQTVLHTKTEVPVFTLTEGTWTLVDRAGIETGDILLFAADYEGNLIWSVLLQKATQQPGNPESSGGSALPDESVTPSTPTESTTPTTQNGIIIPSVPSGISGYLSGGFTEPEPEFELYSLDETQIAAVTPQDTVTLEITIDELDINALQAGMSAQVKLNALGGEKFTASITQIGNVGANNGGNSKYTVELTMDRAENMLPGMNGTATIALSTREDVLTIPADALVENGNQTIVYTGYDEDEDALCNPVAVKIGVSDGETVEILEGLTEGQTYYYAYYDTLEISDTPDFGVGFFGR